MTDLFLVSPDVAWSFAIVLAWIAGEFGARYPGLPRISIYGLVGFVLAYSQAGILPSREAGSMLFIANVAFGLILFELGYRINLRWLLTKTLSVAIFSRPSGVSWRKGLLTGFALRYL